MQNPKQPEFDEVDKAYDFTVLLRAAFIEHHWGKNIPDKDVVFIDKVQSKLQELSNYLFSISHSG